MTKENEGILMARIRNQLRIHWSWLKDKDYNEVADAIDAWMRQALSRHHCCTTKLKKKPKSYAKWANQDVVIQCKMDEAGDLMDILFMADGGPFDAHFKETLKLNNMNEAYKKWLDKMIHIVCREEFEDFKKRKNDRPSKIQQNNKKVK